MTSKTVVLITGANKGIGFETAKHLLASPDYHVIVGSRDPALGREAAAALSADLNTKGTVGTLTLDVVSEASVEAAVIAVSSEHGHLDILVNNAGIYADQPGTSLVEALTRSFAVNVVGTARVTEAFLPLLLKSPAAKPRLVFLTTAMASLAHATDPKSPHFGPYGDAYRATKVALHILMAQYVAKLSVVPGGTRVGVFGADPGFSATDITGGDQETLRNMGARDPAIGAAVVAAVVTGEGDENVGKITDEHGVVPW